MTRFAQYRRTYRVFDENGRLMIQPLGEGPERLLKQDDGSFAMRSSPAAHISFRGAERPRHNNEAGFTGLSAGGRARWRWRSGDVSRAVEVSGAHPPAKVAGEGACAPRFKKIARLLAVGFENRLRHSRLVRGLAAAEPLCVGALPVRAQQVMNGHRAARARVSATQCISRSRAPAFQRAEHLEAKLSRCFQ